MSQVVRVAALGAEVLLRLDCGPALRGRIIDLVDPLRGPSTLPTRAHSDILIQEKDDDRKILVQCGASANDWPNHDAVVDHLLWKINLLVIDAIHHHETGLHASAVQRGERTVVLPALSGSGKSTLAAGLVRDGWRYLTDEAVGLDQDLIAHPYAKPITVDPGSQQLFAAHRPVRDGTASWYLHPRQLNPDWQGEAARVTHVVLPTWAPGRPAEVSRLSPAEGVMALAQNAFYFNADGVRHLRRLAHLVRSVPVWRIAYPDLATGCRLVEQCSTSATAAAVAMDTTSAGLDDDVSEERLADECVIFRRQDRTLHRLDPMATSLRDLLAQAPLDDVVRDVLPAGADRDRVRSDVTILRDRLVDLGLLAG